MKTALLAIVLAAACARSIQGAEADRFFSLPLEEFGGKRLDGYAANQPWSNVPLDKHTFGGVPFLFTSKLQLQGTGDARDNRFYPTQVKGITVGLRVARLHVIHGGNMSDTVGRPMAALRLNYAGGRTHTVLLNYGVHGRDWWKHRTETDSSITDTNSAVVWTGDSPDAKRQGATHRLFKTSLDLPLMEQPAESLDLFSLFSRSSPIFVAITVETPVPGAPTPKPGPSVDVAKYRDELQVAVTEPNGQPVAGARIRVTAVDERGIGTLLGRLDDAQQEPGMVPVDFPAGTRTLRLAVSGTGRVPLEMQLKARPDGKFPDRHAVQLERGGRVSGVVLSSDDEPVARAKVAIYTERRDTAGKVTQARTEELTTDAEGAWRTPQAPRDLERVTFKVTHTDFRPGEFKVSEDGAKNSVTRDALVAGEAQFKLATGLRVAGVVQNEAGSPLAQADVTLRRKLGNGTTGTTRRTDAQGRFTFPVPEPGDALLIASRADFAPVERELKIDESLESQKLTLAPGSKFNGRVLAPRGSSLTNTAPLAGATVSIMTGVDTIRKWTGTTDFSGRFVWEHAPQGALRVLLRQSNYAARFFNATAGPDEVDFILTRNFTVSGRAVDAETRQPIPEFTVTPGDSYTEERVNWRSQYSVQGRNGEFTLGDPSVTGGSGRRVALKAEAPGYWPQRTVVDGEGWQTNVFELRRGTGPKGVVRRPDGQPASGVEIAAIGEDYLTLGKGTFANQRATGPGRLISKSGQDGRFELPIRLSQRVVFVHEQGYAESTLSNLAVQGEVTLQPWGIVEGVLMVGGEPAANAEVILNENRQSDGLRYDFKDFTLKTDRAGRFRFTHVPPGRRWVMRLIPTGTSRSWSHATPVTVEPGQTARVTVGGTGRAVIGKVVPDDATRTIDWDAGGGRSLGTLQPKPPPYRTSAEYQAWSNTPEMKAARETQRNYAVVFHSDGTFRAEDVPPGQYQLSFWFYEPRDRAKPNVGLTSIGQVSREFEIGPLPGGRSDEPLDLGRLDLKVRRVAGLNSP